MFDVPVIVLATFCSVFGCQSGGAFETLETCLAAVESRGTVMLGKSGSCQKKVDGVEVCVVRVSAGMKFRNRRSIPEDCEKIETIVRQRAIAARRESLGKMLRNDVREEDRRIER